MARLRRCPPCCWCSPRSARAPAARATASRRPSEVAVALVEALARRLAARRDARNAASAFGGLAIGGLVGLALGVAARRAAPARSADGVTIELVRPIPSVAVIPVALVALGFGYRLEIAIVAFACTVAGADAHACGGCRRRAAVDRSRARAAPELSPGRASSRSSRRRPCRAFSSHSASPPAFR